MRKLCFPEETYVYIHALTTVYEQKNDKLYVKETITRQDQNKASVHFLHFHISSIVKSKLYVSHWMGDSLG